MRGTRRLSVSRSLGAAASAAAAGYGAYAAATWHCYGRVRAAAPGEDDPLLEQFMPAYEIVERHHVRVDAPAELTLASAGEMDMSRSAVVRAIFKARELILGAAPDETPRPAGLVANVLSLGWVVLAEHAGREIVFGAVTRPWEADVVFRSIPPEQFAPFAEPGYVKIAWTLRADPVDGDGSIFRTETRAVATDAAARARFRLYWALLSPGITIIRRMMLEPVKAEAERRTAALLRGVRREESPGVRGDFRGAPRQA